MGEDACGNKPMTKEDIMYYHCRPLKFVEYGKVFPHPDSDDLFLPAYRWLGHYCGCDILVF